MTASTLAQLAIAALLSCCYTAETALAHHSAVTWDLSKRITIAGTVKVIAFRNPHGHLELLVDGADHKLTTWKVETSSLTILARRGWKTSLIHVGDKLRISGHPHKADPLEIYVREITLKDGTTFGDPTGKDQALD
jgi:hypothetical protein